MSASAPKAAIVKLPWHFRVVPKGDITEDVVTASNDYFAVFDAADRTAS
jgi:hypothetical protein